MDGIKYEASIMVQVLFKNHAMHDVWIINRLDLYWDYTETRALRIEWWTRYFVVLYYCVAMN